MTDRNLNQFDKNRFETYFDAILAIIITVLILEFKVPVIEKASTDDLINVIRSYLPQILSYFFSFTTIIAIWIDHHLLMRRIAKIDKNFIRLNFLFILFLSPLPFTTSFAGKYIYNSFAVALLASNFLLMNLGFVFVFSYSIGKKLIPLPVKHSKEKIDSFISMFCLLLLIISIPLAYVNTMLSFGLFSIIIVLHLFK